MRTINFKNYISIVAILNYQSWLDVSPPLRKRRESNSRFEMGSLKPPYNYLSIVGRNSGGKSFFF